jgi:hypothetical protein
VIIARRFQEKHHPCSLGLNLCFVSLDKGFDKHAFLVLLFENRHPRLRTPGYPKLLYLLTRLYEGLGAELPGLILNLCLGGIFHFLLIYCARAQCGVIIEVVSCRFLHIAICGECDFYSSFALTIL